MKKKEKVAAKPVVIEKPKSWIPWAAVGLALCYVLAGFHIKRDASGFNLAGFGELPVLSGGRLKPLDTVARSSLLVLSGKQTVRFEGNTYSADRWLLEMLTRPIIVDEWPVIRIDDPDVLGMMGIQQTGKRRFSFSELHPFFETIDQQATQALQLEASDRNRFQAAVLALREQLFLYNRIQNSLDRAGRENSYKHLTEEVEVVSGLMKDHAKLIRHGGSSPDVKRLSEFLNEYNTLDQVAEFYPLPSLMHRKSDQDWISTGQAVLQSVAAGSIHPGLASLTKMADAYRSEDVPMFNDCVDGLRRWLKTETPNVLSHVWKEAYFNRVEPFYRALVIYLVVFFLVLAFWLTNKQTYRQTGLALLIFAFGVHTAGLVARMALHGRPPVTNLYSSAIFVGWVAVVLGIVLEKVSKNGLGSLVASLIGFCTLIIAHNLAAQGDTLEMMRAVLDSNFWLATHVVSITVGYGSTFLSGAIGIVYIVRRLFDRSWNEETATSLEKMAYGVVCFSLFFSFVGTILGGIWADQSWGRFWGWDPKENGALMIVLWNAFILHARWGKMTSERGIMAMLIFGNIVTALSWFGVNMLGIGLHSYGFMDKAFFWLVIFVFIQAGLIGMAYLPAKRRV